MNVHIKRVYDPVEPGDGFRVLVDRLWPRGLSREAAEIDLWVKDLAPSTELRRWFHGDAGTWAEFQKRYNAELSTHKAAAIELRKQIGRRKTTFVYASKSVEHNHAKLLKAYLGKL